MLFNLLIKTFSIRKTIWVNIKDKKMSIHVKNNVYWVGKIDWDLRKFHGDEYSTNRGTSYNSYLIKEEKKE